VRADGLTIAVTPQITQEAIVTLSLSPMVASPQVVQSDMIARVADGETIVVAGFGRDHETREHKTSRTGGWFGRSTVVTKKHIELVVLLTPRILPLP
jgi:type II secretory pathway component GspD/PulD (secretin)